ncbi:sensor histidine kinase [Lysobacter arvi]|uniref:histidine kinase n=1 Tax=Lysobacter arvi TaxID=3038776 RepID=A0ABU1CA29_9GAMM|nr:ATP-binding protein [Lysobacter arvi]MDR0182053.1 7TM diverse intracellular signaling domain-containing protein [Lysobacter arvi]
MPPRLLLTLLLALAAFAWPGGARAHSFAGSGGAIDLGPHATYVDDPGGRWSIDDVRRMPAGAFARGGPLERARYRDGAVWIRIELPRDLPAGAWWLVPCPAQVDSVRLYGEGLPHDAVTDLGTQVPFSARAVPFRQPVFALAPGAADPGGRVLFLRIASQTAILATPTLWRPDAFAAMAGREYALWGLYFGVLGLLVLLNLYFWFDLRRPLYLYCAVYLALFLALLLLLEGFAAQWWFPDRPGSVVYLTRAIALVAMGYTLWFGVQLIEIGRRWPWAHALACTLSLVLVSGVVLLLFLPDGAVLEAMLWLRVLWQPAFAFLLIAQWRARPDLRWVVAAFAVQVAGSSAAMGHTLGLVPSNEWARHSLDIAGLVHMIMLSVALMSRLRDSERRALEMSMRAEARLDQKVSERTAELASINRQLVTEIAERRAAQAELDAALRSERATHETQRDFVAMVSHEFRTPLSIIKAVAQRLRTHASLAEPDLQQRLSRLDRATQRMTAMIETYLADDRMREPEAARPTTAFAPRALIAAAAELHSAMDERLDAASHDALPDCHGDLPLLTIALSNLIDNALKYSPLETAVRVRAHDAGDHVRIDVRDRGPGVPEGERERIFQRYVRGSDGSGRPGAGLGLHLARAIARRNGGDLVLVDGGAEGATFSLRIPVAATPGPSSTRPDVADAAPPIAPGM